MRTSMGAGAASTSTAMNPFVEMVEALSNRHGQVDIRLDRFSVKLPFAGEIELSGSMTVSVHMRPLSDREVKAHENRQLRAISG